MHLNTPFAIALAMVISTTSYAFSVPQKQHHTIIDRSSNLLYHVDLEEAGQFDAHGPMQPATSPFHLSRSPSVGGRQIVSTVKTVTVFPTPIAKAPSEGAQPVNDPFAGGTRRPVSLVATSTATSSSSSSKQNTAASTTTTDQLLPTVFVVPFPLTTISFTWSVPATIIISSNALPSAIPSSLSALSSSAVAQASSLASSLADQASSAAATKTTTSSTSSSTSTTASDSDQTDLAASTSTTTTTSSTPTCSTGTTRKCCSKVKNVSSKDTTTSFSLLGVVDELLPGVGLNFLALGTTIGLDCVDVNDDDTINTDGDMCWDIISCCENQSLGKLGSIYLGCETLT